MEIKDSLYLIRKLLNPIPQYILGCLPAVAIVGDTPKEKLTEKLAWVLRCLGCPFTGLFYSCNVGSNKTDQCLFWLPSDYFKCENDGQLYPIKVRPVGIHGKILEPNEKQRISAEIKRCTARASVLERLSSLVSAYYIFVGIIAGISRVTNQTNVCEDWPYIPLLLSWTIPSIYKRIIWGHLIVKNPKIEMEDLQPITLKEINDDEIRNHKRFTVTFTAFASILFPWITVLLAYFTPPIGYRCRSKYVSVLCAIWSLNSALAYLCHLKGERGVSNFCFGIFHIWFSICGFVVAMLIFFLGILTNNSEWWTTIFGPSCDILDTTCT
ncbi:hypothetical protein RhiirA5_411119 [Rhizophagus irregularis]|uniref:Uncharacterized protein n=3 Tax=Rhizophagus irregularis TaxID=588596 RepID=U9UNA5_RHIID|nr:hypothetical protein GLOIN_2v1809498 [Rhizophagus irregularis DAOM 181602=DAOM 197198]EXX77920.1 hypothetical protein RirG_019440 [Rhizophagus irregularis DAOM 197198w]PKC13010.1 hypothetical protein RhiirA5_411119 [Rhizophagus irregularis]PKC73848.1 hypothetical protein RhiirA1_450691 [Rhizophagus irregularis]PKY16160.1 hypothetical protein RhiirB3_381520 [Rhizophagus irregularis]POG79024.1 hypothetical protein GLOIN_2v1809498 [Rhizophagus irregularis DAOM 181602=DAOM 197198]|eukprot:XP_025185890.1 hypothetical protein GLOIN_2v1809498 [Rhizophagus irregularis DAOM 181602=DAOM 197198]